MASTFTRIFFVSETFRFRKVANLPVNDLLKSVYELNAVRLTDVKALRPSYQFARLEGGMVNIIWKTQAGVHNTVIQTPTGQKFFDCFSQIFQKLTQ